ncbi:MAG: 4Fe-4S dicluster domain-containing protein [Candidatus Latescibacterota bacterium]|nr:MAG: 4Fe-4S dicluster domain-containing protein [Candidatus Latescibacterota bacterium]
MERRIIRIDEERCTGCALCIPNCPEGAIQIIEGKARLVGDLLCDGLGACIGHCPEGAITIETREAEAYDERKVVAGIVRQGPAVLRAHLEHLRSHGQRAYLGEALAYLAESGVPIPAGFTDSQRPAGHPLRAAQSGGCPGSRIMNFNGAAACTDPPGPEARPSRLGQWPVQLELVPPEAPFLDGADVLVAADCVPFAYAGFHERLLRGKVCLVGCPKLDDAERHLEKLAAMFERNDVRSVTTAYMEVPCCFGMVKLVEEAIARSGKRIPLETRKLGVKGEPMGWS